MKDHLTLGLSVLVASLSLAGCEKKTDTTTPKTGAAQPAPAPDNTAKNKVDGSGDTVTPMDQSQAASDIKTTADIRRAIMGDSNMSINAQNCKIVTDKSGLVTLRGVVNSQAEKDSIDAKAKTIAGATRVDNQLEIKPN